MQNRQVGNLKTQISPVEICEKLLDDLDLNVPVENTNILVNPLEFLEVPYNLKLDENRKKDTLDVILKTSALSLLDNNYPEPEWIRVYTDGSRMNNAAGAGVYCKLFSQYAPVGQHLSNFDAEVYAVFLAVSNLKSRIESFSKAVILVDSRSAIEAIALQHYSEPSIVTKIKQNIRFLNMNSKTVEFQWIPSHVDIDGNERADVLAKKGTDIFIERGPIPLDSLRRSIRENIMSAYNMELSINSKGKLWETIRDDWSEFSRRPRKEAVANFRLKTGHDCLALHLSRIGILTSSLCPICKTDVMNGNHLLVCPDLDPTLQQKGDVCLLYWRARELMS